MAERGAGPTGFAPTVAAGSSTWDRVILHVDMDAFFASVEVLDDPSLRGLPVIVGGSGSRGVVAACTYEARMFGVHSAMPSSMARRLCPAAVFVDGRFHRYVEESGKLHDIFESVTPLVEGISLDEAFLDVTGSRQLLGDGATIAESIRRRVAEELELTCSVGVGRSKLMAKLASKAAKPVADRRDHPRPGVVVVPPDGELDFLHPLPVRALWGVGPVTGRGSRPSGSTRWETSPPCLRARSSGIWAWPGRHLAALSRGHDPRPVVPDQEAKSIGHEETFASDLWDRSSCSDTCCAWSMPRRRLSVGPSLRPGPSRSRSGSETSPRSPGPTPWALRSTPPRPSEPWPPLSSTRSSSASGVRLLGVSLSGFGREEVGTQLSLDLGRRTRALTTGPPAPVPAGARAGAGRRQ